MYAPAMLLVRVELGLRAVLVFLDFCNETEIENKLRLGKANDDFLVADFRFYFLFPGFLLKLVRPS